MLATELRLFGPTLKTECCHDANFVGWHNDNLQMPPKGLIQYKMPSAQYMNSLCGDKVVLLPSYLHNGISFTVNTTSLYWIRAQGWTKLASWQISIFSDPLAIIALAVMKELLYGAMCLEVRRLLVYMFNYGIIYIRIYQKVIPENRELPWCQLCRQQHRNSSP